MLNRWFRRIATGLILTLGFGISAQAESPVAGAASPGRGGVLEELTHYSIALFQKLASGDGGLCGTGYCPTPPQPPPPIHSMSLRVIKPHLLREGSLQ
jgi:hypothetical protein